MITATDKEQDAAKRFANLRARAALSGVEVYTTTDDRGAPLYVCVKWALTKHLQTLDALAAWLAMVDGKAE